MVVGHRSILILLCSPSLFRAVLLKMRVFAIMSGKYYHDESHEHCMVTPFYVDYSICWSIWGIHVSFYAELSYSPSIWYSHPSLSQFNDINLTNITPNIPTTSQIKTQHNNIKSFLPITEQHQRDDPKVANGHMPHKLLKGIIYSMMRSLPRQRKYDDHNEGSYRE
jgi:hypothetical protein